VLAGPGGVADVVGAVVAVQRAARTGALELTGRAVAAIARAGVITLLGRVEDAVPATVAGNRSRVLPLLGCVWFT
jgi:hypothetical protein